MCEKTECVEEVSEGKIKNEPLWLHQIRQTVKYMDLEPCTHGPINDECPACFLHEYVGSPEEVKSALKAMLEEYDKLKEDYAPIEKLRIKTCCGKLNPQQVVDLWMEGMKQEVELRLQAQERVKVLEDQSARVEELETYIVESHKDIHRCWMPPSAYLKEGMISPHACDICLERVPLMHVGIRFYTEDEY